MAQKIEFPRDRFDQIPIGGERGNRIGAHRADPKSRSLGKWILGILACSLILTLAGVLWLNRVGADSTVFSSVAGSQSTEENTDTEAAAEEAAAEAAAEEAAAAEAQAAAEAAAAEAAAAQAAAEAAVEPVINPNASVSVVNGTLTAGLASNVSQQIAASGWGSVMFIGNADVQDVQTSVVYYIDPASEPAALALAEQLGIAAQLDPNYANFGTEMVVLLGADYAAPVLQ